MVVVAFAIVIPVVVFSVAVVLVVVVAIVFVIMPNQVIVLAIDQKLPVLLVMLDVYRVTNHIHLFFF